jgi:hypothetical protein
MLDASHSKLPLRRVLRLSYLGLLSMMSAAITPGIQARQVSKNTIRNEPHPWSATASGGNMIASKTRIKDIFFPKILICWYLLLPRFELLTTLACRPRVALFAVWPPRFVLLLGCPIGPTLCSV